jgi:hypothetical protein
VNDIVEAFVSRAQRAKDVNARATPGPLLVRGALWVFTVAAVFTAYPSGIVWNVRALPVVALWAAFPAALPRTRIVSLALFGIVVGWVIATTAYGEDITAARLVLLATLLYLMHTTAALASVLPYDTVVVGSVLIAWYVRALPALAGSAVFGVLAVAGAGVIVGRSYLIAAISGIAVVCGAAWLLVRASRS